MSQTIETLARLFRRFGERECVPASPLYGRLAVGISDDAELLALAATARARPVPNLFLAAAHALLLSDSAHPLAAFYPDIARDSPPAQGDPFPQFRAFCLQHADLIEQLLATRRVQTNEVRRCACLLPAFAIAARRLGDRPLSLVEIGASAGLNLLWDHYHVDYGAAGQCGDPNTLVRLACELRGDCTPPLPTHMPEIATRVGLDLNPIDLRDSDAALWLRALIWPEQLDRAALLAQAIEAARDHPPPLLAGDAIELLPGVLANVPAESGLCIYHSFTLNQFPAEARKRLADLLAEHAAKRDIALIALEWREPHAALDLSLFLKGARADQRLAHCDAHGSWMEWLA
ncbi:MAG TPA: DUF2332 domain-containing protein [Roseiflexaceae bacterium]|nr:DUF2332 domain-containing protein [Roseiflexaceae bacterium]